jgi:DNA-directed RNA polymerase subunit RPC12/RpoP
MQSRWIDANGVGRCVAVDPRAKSHPKSASGKSDKSRLVKCGECGESNNSGVEVENNEYKMPYFRCPICDSPMHKSGQLQMTNPLTGRKKMVQVYYCNRCGYKTLG